MERRFATRGRWWIGGLIVLALLGSGGVAWVERASVWTWYSIGRLAAAGEGDREYWAGQVAALDQAALPRLLSLLRQEDTRRCANAAVGLRRLADRWPAEDARRARLAEQLAEAFAGLSPAGRHAALELQTDLLLAAPAGGQASGFWEAASRLAAAAASVPDSQARAQALTLTECLLDRGELEDVRSAARDLARACLQDQAPDNRIWAIHLALRPGMGLLGAIKPLLKDPVPAVRRYAMLALGPAEGVVHTDDLLPWLHDPDEQVRRLCEKALRSRGLQNQHLLLGRLMTDSKPGARLQVLALLPQVQDLEPNVWLRRLSHDQAPAVRAAAVRAAAEQSATSLRDRLEQMAQNDPCPTVRQLAQFYLSCQRNGGNLPAER